MTIEMLGLFNQMPFIKQRWVSPSPQHLSCDNTLEGMPLRVNYFMACSPELGTTERYPFIIEIVYIYVYSSDHGYT